MSAIKHITLREHTYDVLLNLILSGELGSGASIDERALIERLSVSRTPFREAIALLANEGLVEIRPYRGFSVRQFTQKEISDLFDFRCTLEGFAIRLAVERISNAQIARLKDALDASVAALRAGEMAEYGRCDKEFHDTIAQISGNGALIEALARLSRQIQICRAVANRDDGLAERAVQERDDILKALRERDADRAAELMELHIRDVKAQVMRTLALAEPEQTGPGTRRH